MTYLYEQIPYIVIFGEKLNLIFFVFLFGMTFFYAFLVKRTGSYTLIRALFIGGALAVFMTFFREAFWLILCDANLNGFQIFAEGNPMRQKEIYMYVRNIGISAVLSFYYIKLSKEGHISVGRHTKLTGYVILGFYAVGSLFLNFPDYRFPHTWTVIGEVGSLIWHLISKSLFLVLGAMPFYDKQRS